jgi:hypothetical protein
MTAALAIVNASIVDVVRKQIPTMQPTEDLFSDDFFGVMIFVILVLLVL